MGFLVLIGIVVALGLALNAVLFLLDVLAFREFSQVSPSLERLANLIEADVKRTRESRPQIPPSPKVAPEQSP